MQNHITTEEKVWDPSEIFDRSVDHKYAVIILNQPIRLHESFILPLWREAQIKITVDGGTNRWMEYLGPLSNKIYDGKCPDYAPDMVTGDLDSILPEIRTNLENIGVRIYETIDQQYTDFSKALMKLSAECKSKNISLHSVYVLVETAGRLDQIIANINTLYRSREFMEDKTPVICISSNSLTWLLRSGEHRIKIPEKLRTCKSWVGLIPFGPQQNSISSTGLKYNLDKLNCSFGGLISTSNTYDGSPEVTVTTNTDIIWTMSIESLVPLKTNFT
ncbi:thiamin pyrophosphokinase 1 [Chelonus insularis]|uniref:thiamin pyrophosphokinase 1 n=1 Tax=Chelonus insularis TaxID=460826 RepID=UPI00158C1F13|nr:thiamin pyrophosphokinase 1 [Chelonus insularis]XP_034944901.1 thiamin pyrophosphokinase 1 [Chelonus insularis]